MEKLKMESLDKINDNIEYIAKRFPNAVTEVLRDGKIELAVDFDVLKQEMSEILIDDKEERYQFTWPDKKKAILLANSPIAATLRPCKEESVNFENTQNLYIEGDNLDVLKLLQETYLGKVKMIYIDPPYNTGNDFVYEDDFAQSAEEYKDNSGQYDEQGNRLVQNTESNGRFHTDWLNMIYPRIRIARDLLSEDGVIFISIDDNEVSNLREVADEVFGQNNFIADLIWQKKFSRSNDASYFSTMHDHILCYAKNNIQGNENGWKIGLLPRGNEMPTGYANPDNDPRGVWTSVVLSAKSGGASLLYEIVTPSGRKCTPPSGRYWSVSQETLKKWIADNRIWFGADGDGTPRKKTFLSEVQEGLRPNTILFQNEVGHNQEGKQETKALFDGIGVFDGPKPVRLLRTLIRIANLSADDIVLDFFSGSATTAQAVFQANVEEETTRKFIMIQLPEICDKDSEAYKAGYANICEIGKERIRRAGMKISEENRMLATKLDIGFRVFKLDSSNMKDVYYKPSDYSQSLLDTVEDNIKEDRTPLDLLFQVMLDLGKPLSAKIEEKVVAGKKVFVVNTDDLICCLDNNVTDEVVTEIAKMHPLYAVFRDSSLANDSVGANFDQIFATYSPNTTRRVL